MITRLKNCLSKQSQFNVNAAEVLRKLLTGGCLIFITTFQTFRNKKRQCLTIKPSGKFDLICKSSFTLP